VVRVGRPFRPLDELDAGMDRRAAKPLVTRMILERIAVLLPVAQRGAYGSARGAEPDPMR
jgi:hypothetical protein